MKFKVTLKQLREHKACVEGYNKVVCFIKKIPYVEKKTYMVVKHNEAISLLSILDSNGLNDALWCLRCNDTEWARDSRLFAVWCARQVQHLINDECSLKVLNVAKEFANNNATLQELRDARDTRAAARDAAWAAVRDDAWAAARDAARAAAWDVACAAPWDAKDAQKEMFIKMCNGEAPWQVV